MSNDGFSLDVSIPAEEWAFTKRRLQYLEAVLVQVLRDENRVQEWYSTAEIVAMRLPGLPFSKTGLIRFAKSQDWMKRTIPSQGGKKYLFHYANFPARAFDTLINKILDVPKENLETKEMEETTLPEILEAIIEPPKEVLNTAPPWVLPFMRLLKGEAKGNIRSAWVALPDHLPKGVDLPDRHIAAETMLRLGIVKEL